MLTFILCQRRFALKGFADASPEFPPLRTSAYLCASAVNIG
jgi:hypothetical protein